VGGGTQPALLAAPKVCIAPCWLQVAALGSRKRDSKGELGPYTWLTYSQVGPRRAPPPARDSAGPIALRGFSIGARRTATITGPWYTSAPRC
jgi:hypothetical protein